MAKSEQMKVAADQYRSIIFDMESDLRDALGACHALMMALSGFGQVDLNDDDAVDGLIRLSYHLHDKLHGVKTCWDKAFPGEAAVS